MDNIFEQTGIRINDNIIEYEVYNTNELIHALDNIELNLIDFRENMSEELSNLLYYLTHIYTKREFKLENKSKLNSYFTPKLKLSDFRHSFTEHVSFEICNRLLNKPMVNKDIFTRILRSYCELIIFNELIIDNFMEYYYHDFMQQFSKFIGDVVEFRKSLSLNKIELNKEFTSYIYDNDDYIINNIPNWVRSIVKLEYDVITKDMDECRKSDTALCEPMLDIFRNCEYVIFYTNQSGEIVSPIVVYDNECGDVILDDTKLAVYADCVNEMKGRDDVLYIPN